MGFPLVSPAQRAEILRSVRGVLTRHNVDIYRIQVSVTRLSVCLRGMMLRLPGTIAPLDEYQAKQIFNEIRRVPRMPRLEIAPDPGVDEYLLPTSNAVASENQWHSRGSMGHNVVTISAAESS
ncbi:MAG: hypothetical protein PHR35_21310 [Kiritimatiellae bacterium]|nr:hypothetical protein [Kiritimatiellia bacterium]